MESLQIHSCEYRRAFWNISDKDQKMEEGSAVSSSLFYDAVKAELLCNSGRGFRENVWKASPESTKAPAAEANIRTLLRVYLKNPNAPGQRAFSRCAAPFFLEIRQYSCEKMSCSAQKFLAAYHIGSFQMHPSRARSFRYPGLDASRP